MRLRGPILIAGGGIGGLTAAVALRRHGFVVRVFERQASREVQLAGTGLTLWSNATTALGRLGLGDEIGALGAEIREVRNVSETGAVIFRMPVYRHTWPGSLPGVALSRGDLAGALLAAAERAGVEVCRGSAVVGYGVDANGVTVALQDGTHATGSLLIGADGIRSAVHAQLRGELSRVYSGHSTYRAISEVDTGLEPGIVYVLSGRGGYSGALLRIGGGRASWTIGRPAPAGLPRNPGGPDWHRSALGDLAVLAGLVPAIVAGTPARSIARTDIHYHEWSECWGAGPVTLLGDAAHAMPTVLGQGPAQAIEDAVVLADCLAGAADPVAALRWYEGRRIPRVRQVRARIMSMLGVPAVHHPALLWLHRRAVGAAATVLGPPVWRMLQRPPDLRHRVPGPQAVR